LAIRTTGKVPDSFPEAVALLRAGSQARREWLLAHRPAPRQLTFLRPRQEEDDLLC
jgi:hypothetical protein